MYSWTRVSSGKLMLLLGVSAGRDTVGCCYSTKALSWHKVTTNWDVYTWKGGAEQSIPNSPAPKTSLSRVHVEMQSPVHCSKSLGTCLFNKLPKWFF